MNNDLAALIVHDIKNALGILEGELSIMTERPTRERAVTAHDTCATLRDKLIGFLTLYKASSQGLTAQVDGVNPEDFLHSLLRQRLSARPEIRVEIDNHAMPALGFFDENLVGLALEAALQNATRFARAAIRLGCSMQEDDLVFTVHDDGPGLGTKEVKPSTGLGMALCQAIAQAHARSGRVGSASVENHPQGGAVFMLRLP